MFGRESEEDILQVSGDQRSESKHYKLLASVHDEKSEERVLAVAEEC